MSNKMLIDAAHPEETRVVVLRGNRVEDFDFESASKKPLRGNIYLAKVTRVEPSLQAAFIEYGGNRHGFLAFSEIHPDYYQIPVADRQALLEEEARAHREEDEESRPHNNQRRSRRHRRNGSSEKRAVQDGEAVSGPADAPHDEVDAENALESGFEGEDSASDREVLADGDEAVSSASAGAEPLLPFAAAAEADEVLTEEEAEFASTEAPIEAASEQPAAEQSATEAPEAESAPEAVSEGGSELAAEEPAEVEAAASEEIAVEAQADEQPVIDHAIAGQATEAFAEKHEGEDDAEGETEEEVVEQIGGDALEDVPYRAPRLRRHYKIQEVIKRRQILLVQVVKEERGNKGAALTTYLSLAGRYSVLMPNTARGGGISRKITDSEDRKRLKSIAHELDVPEGMGIILRTAGASRSESEVKRDFEYLLRMWETIRELTLRSTAPTLVYEEGSLIKRAIRDLYSKEMDEVCVAGEAAYREARDFMRLLMPSHIKQVRLYGDTQPIFAKSGVEAQLDAMFSNHVTLRSGGYIVINQTEALVAIDVNSGRSTREHNIEDTALRTNLEAADEVARQLRLRDLAGLIVVDFIDMEESRNNRAVERRMKEALKNDRARIQIGRISHFGLLEMSRQRIRTGVLEGSTVLCPHCAGAGTVRSTSSIALHVLRVLEDTLIRSSDFNLIVRTRMEVALYILNQKRAHLSDLEQRFGVMVTVLSDPALTGTVYHALERGDAATPPPRIASFVSPADSSVAEEDDFEAEIDSEEDENEAQDAGESQATADHRGAESDEAGGERRRRRRRRRRGRDRDDRSPGAAADSEEGAADTTDDVAPAMSADASEDSGDLPDEAVLSRDLAEPAGQNDAAADADRADVSEAPTADSQPEAGETEADAAPTEEPRRRRSRRSAARSSSTADEGATSSDSADEGSPAPRRSRRTRTRNVEEESSTLLPFAGTGSQPAVEAPASEPTPEVTATQPDAEPIAETSTTQGEARADSEPTTGSGQDQASSTEVSSPAAEPAPAAPEPETPPAPERPKRSGWWQRAKATLTGE